MPERRTSSIGSPRTPSSDTVPPAALRRGALALAWCLLPWPAAWYGLYVHRSGLLAFFLYHVVCFTGGWLLRAPGLPETDSIVSLRRRHLGAVVLAANGIAWLLYAVVGGALLDRPHILGLMSENGLPPASYAWLFPYFAFVNPLAEEYFWRGGVYPTLRRLYASHVPPTLIASVLFAGWHWTVFRLFVEPIVALLGVLLVTLVGVALCIVYERTRRLAYAVILHALAGDAPLLLLLLLLGVS